MRTAFRAREHISLDHRETNLVPIEEEIRLYMALSSDMLTGSDIFSTMSSASARARLNADIMTTGCMFRSS